MSKKYLYYFSEGNDAFGGDKVTMKNILGGKGAGLAEMTAAGMPVPQGFTITTEACTQYYADGRQINDEITADIFEHVKGLEKITGKTFGDNENPLLVSVRSGARQSMPGMMDTILNLGLNDEAVEGLAKKTNNARFAYDCYRRFVQMFADVVMMVPKSLFEVEIDKMKEAKGVKNDVDLTADDLKELVGTFKKIYEDNEGRPFPQDPKDQLIESQTISGSSAEVGSSNNMISGSIASARAIATRCCCPPESCFGFASAFSARPTRFNSSRAFFSASSLDFNLSSTGASIIFSFTV